MRDLTRDALLAALASPQLSHDEAPGLAFVVAAYLDVPVPALAFDRRRDGWHFTLTFDTAADAKAAEKALGGGRSGRELRGYGADLVADDGPRPSRRKRVVPARRARR